MTRPESLQVGGVYSIDNGDGSFGVAKLLVVDEAAAHIRVYKNRFTQRPTQVQPSELTLGSINDPDGFGMGHLPLQRDTFLLWKPKLIAVTSVTDEELDGYKMWKEAGGGLFQ
jgi:hypothetical protein